MLLLLHACNNGVHPFSSLLSTSALALNKAWHISLDRLEAAAAIINGVSPRKVLQFTLAEPRAKAVESFSLSQCRRAHMISSATSACP